jgi:flavin reductase (DIM6/NTAB) family NADH-FMN oxidoreductase RutF
MANKFTEIQMLDNFYQTSSFFPMPVLLVSTLSESGRTNLGPYSLCFPRIVTGKGKYAMSLISRGTSNTAQNIIRNKVCALNFIPNKKKYLKNCIMLGYPGESTEEKMKNSIFSLIPSTRQDDSDRQYPPIVEESVQIFECTWDESYPLRHDQDLVESHFVLHIDKIIMKEKWRDRLFKGRGFPSLPIDFGYRDNVRFWFANHSRPYALPVPKEKGNSIDVVRYACDRYDPDITWEDAACEKIIKVPPVFLKMVIGGVVKQAKKKGLSVITPDFMDKVQDKRSSEK